MKKYKVVAYIKVPDYDGSWIFNTKEEAETELDQLQLMQPENIYKIEKVIVNNFPDEEQLERDINYREKD